MVLLSEGYGNKKKITNDDLTVVVKIKAEVSICCIILETLTTPETF